MDTHNAMPQAWRLPTSALEAFQAGRRAYLNLAWLAAVPGDALAAAHGQQHEWLTCSSERLTDQIAYLQAANARLARLHPTAHLVAVTAT